LVIDPQQIVILCLMARITHEVWTNAGNPHSGLHMEWINSGSPHSGLDNFYLLFERQKTLLYIRSELQSTISTQTTKKVYKV